MLFIHLPVDEHLSCFCFLTIMNDGAMNTHGQVFVWPYVFISLGYVMKALS